jgi:pimeloyl-ACP methyl ester carboxylesterase
MTTMKAAFRKADGLDVRYAEAGQDNGETVVLTCPWPESLFAFRKVWDRLAEDFHLVAIDLPGFGQSERRIELLSPTAMGDFLVRMIQEWNLGPVHFVGPDVGTSATLVAAAAHPELVRSLAIGSGATALPLQVGGTLKDIIEAPNMDGYRQLDSRQLLAPVFDSMPGGAPPPGVRADYLDSYAGDRFVESARYVRTYPTELPALAERLPGITTPVLIIGGANDDLVPQINHEFLHERLPNSRLEPLPAGHFCWEEVPDLYGGSVLRWLKLAASES